ncbi:protein IL-40 isoform X3 [Artibeus jamaicensis]|uniref:protein IL-40 isoform X3 n=1 Tax=Artibeus jamaicensis TaxID=9417 RepID=UPI00235A586F|nr:protein IL-40 isoform X3 [Artibeus jamaicensis]
MRLLLLLCAAALAPNSFSTEQETGTHGARRQHHQRRSLHRGLGPHLGHSLDRDHLVVEVNRAVTSGPNTPIAAQGNRTARQLFPSPPRPQPHRPPPPSALDFPTPDISHQCNRSYKVLPEVSIAYRVLEVFPRGRRVLITCHSPSVPPPITYSLWGSQNIQVAKKVVNTRDPASFSVNVTLKSRPDLLTYTCQGATTWGAHMASAKLQLYWELWAEPVSQLKADFNVLDEGAGPRAEVSCRASSGSPPITYHLVGKDGHIHMQQTPHHGQPANFSFPLTQASYWYQCQAKNDISVQSSPFILVPPGQLPKGPTFVLAASLTAITAITSGMLGWTAWTRRSHHWNEEQRTGLDPRSPGVLPGGFRDGWHPVSWWPSPLAPLTDVPAHLGGLGPTWPAPSSHQPYLQLQRVSGTPPSSVWGASRRHSQPLTELPYSDALNHFSKELNYILSSCRSPWKSASGCLSPCSLEF